MKQKYLISRSKDNKILLIQELAEIDKDVLSATCEVTYDDSAIESAIEKGSERLIAVLRTKNFFPPGFYMDKISGSVMSMYATQNFQQTEIFVDETEILLKDREALFALEDAEVESPEMEELLEDNFDEDYEGKDAIKNINTPLKLAEDETLDTEED